MAKERHDQTETSTPKTALMVMAAGTILVAALIVWALTRKVEPAVEEPVAQQTAAIETAAAPETAGTTAPPPPRVEGDRTSVVRISAEDTREQMRNGNAVVIDVRDASAFKRSHIAGAIHVPFAGVEAAMATLPKDKLIVAYCT